MQKTVEGQSLLSRFNLARLTNEIKILPPTELNRTNIETIIINIILISITDSQKSVGSQYQFCSGSVGGNRIFYPPLWVRVPPFNGRDVNTTQGQLNSEAN
jgi:hypothetical protein